MRVEVILTALDSASLARSLSYWEWAEYFACLLVAIGCAGEYVAEFTDWLTDGDKDRKIRLSKKSTLLLIASLAFEIVCLYKANSISGLLIGSLSERAAAADAKAQSALNKSDTAEAKADEAERSSSEAQILSKGTRQEADSFAGDIKSAKQRAADAESHLAGALKQVARAEQQVIGLERELTWRELTPSESSTICSVLGSYSGTKMVVESIAGDAEAAHYADDFVDALNGKDCGWKVSATSVVLLSSGSRIELPQGLIIEVKDVHNSAATALQRALSTVGLSAPGQISERVPSGYSFDLFVGVKPRAGALTNGSPQK